MNHTRQYIQEISEIDKKYNQREKRETIQFAIIIIAIIIIAIIGIGIYFLANFS
jgi:predicted nucleic acid-binding Zn ribbon protein